MDRRAYKSKPQHLVTDPRTGEIKTIIHPSDTNVGTAAIPANLTVFGATSVVSQSAQYLSASTVQVATLVDASGSMYLDNTVFGLRLSLSSSAAIPIVDIASGSTLYLTPYTSGRASVYNGRQWVGFNSSEISRALSGLTVDKNYDVFLYLNGNTPAIELSSAWSNDQNRSQALTRQDGILVKSADRTRRYVGTIRTVSTSHAADSKAKRFVWNYYNRVPRPLNVTESTDSWTYSGTSYRVANGVAANSFEFVAGDDVNLRAIVNTVATAASTGWGCSVGIGIDSTSVNSAGLYGSLTNASLYFPCSAEYNDFPGVGYHRVSWLEISGGITITWYGDVGFPAYNRYGLLGVIQG